MKKTATWLAALCAALLALHVVGCEHDPEPVAVESVALNTTTLTLAPGETGKLTATVVPSDADDRTVKWLSSNTDVVMVDSNGTVGAISVGIATITAQAGGKTAVCLITVKQEPVAVERVTLDATALTIAPGGTRKLTATVLPSNADDTAVAWSSSNADVATVGTDGTVTAHAEGTATITAQAGGKTATCTVTVKPILIAVESVALDMTTLTLTRGETERLTATVLPGDAEDKTVAWSSSDTDVATVGADGTVTAIKAGTATITARAGDKAAACTVTVQEVTENPEPVAVENVTLDATALTLTRGETGKLTATVLPENADDKTVTWQSSDPSVATVGEDGTVTAVMVGSASITAQAGDKTATCVVTVNPIPVTDITLNASALTLTPGTTSKLTATVLPENADGVTVTWSSSDDKVATVDADGTVTTITEGTAVITAQAGGKTAECTVSVKQILIAVEKVALNTTTLMLTRGETGTLTATVTPDNADDTTVLWSSSDPSVATVDNDGTVTTHKAGTATVTATAQTGGKTATCVVTVNPIAVERVTLNTTTLTLTRGGTGKLTATVTPSDADDKTVAWLSSDTSVATVGSDGTVTAVKAGTATITARAGGKTATCVATVNPIAVERVTLNTTTLALARGTTGKLTATVTPDNADDTTVIWSSSDPAVATVDNDGAVTAHAAGTATITATAKTGGKTAGCTVTVNPIRVDSVMLSMTTLTLTRGETGKLTATVTPDNADDKTVAWSSSDTSVATVDNDGTVTAVKAGTATITAQAGNRTAECMVTVHIHSYSGGKCTVCGAVPYMENGTIDDRGVLTEYRGYKSTVVIPDGVTGIGDSVFSGYRSLTGIEIPDSVTSIGDSAFSGCTYLTSVRYGGTLADWCSITWGNYSANPLCSGKAVLYIGNEAVRDAVIPDSVTEIKNYAFSGYTRLTGVTIPNSVTSIGNYAFYGCTDLTSVTIPDSVTSIGDSAFYGCKYLTGIEIPDSVTSIGKYAFSDCTDLTSVRYGGTLADWCSITWGDSYANPLYYGKSVLYIGNKAVTAAVIPNSVTEIKNYAFYGYTSLTSVTIPNSVTSIGNYAFFGCTILAHVNIPNSITCIENYVFACCGLTSVNIPSSITSIGNSAFYGCTKLTSVTISNSVTSIGDNVFYECTNLKEVRYDGTLAQWCAKSGACLTQYAQTITLNDVDNLMTLTNLVIPSGVTSIVRYAFRGCTKLTSVTIPDSVTSIGYAAFYECTSLTSVKIGNGVTSIGIGAFYGCTKLTGVTIPDSVTSIERVAFYGCASLKNVTIPGSVTSIKDCVFQKCTGLTSVVMADGVTSIEDRAFCECTSLKSVTIPSSVTSIGDNTTITVFGVFSGCKNLTTINYTGTEEQWNAITKGSYWDSSAGSYTITYNYNE